MTEPIPYATPYSGKRRRYGCFIASLIAIVLVVLFFAGITHRSPAMPTVPFSVFYAQVKADNISRIVIDGDEVAGQFRGVVRTNGMTVASFQTYLPSGIGSNWSFVQWLEETGPSMELKAEPANNLLTSFILPMIPWLLILAFIWFVVFRQLRNARKTPMPVVVVSPEQR